MKFFIFTCLMIPMSLLAQNNTIPNQVMALDEFLGYVKMYHPLVSQANLDVSQAQANIMVARGGFDPKVEVDYNTKQFRSSEYYSILNSSFKIPTWYGIEVKAGFDQTEGIYLNPENNMPNAGLATLGISVPLGQGLIINKRMADLRKAKIYNTLSVAERDLEVATIIYDAIIAYTHWYQSYTEYKLYETFLENAQQRFDGVKNLVVAGDRPAIDSVETRILVRDRQLKREQAQLKWTKASLELSNFLWLENNIPIELQDNIIPEESLEKTIANTLETNGFIVANMDWDNHPKIIALNEKIKLLEIERKLSSDRLKPQLNFNYNYINEPLFMDEWNFNNYKYGLQFSFPLFLRKERGELKIAKFRVQDANFERDLESLILKNKIDYQWQEIESLDKQMIYIENLVSDYQTMLSAEERLFLFGESSLFLINTRENSFLTSSLEQIRIYVNFCISHAVLYQLLARPQ